MKKIIIRTSRFFSATLLMLMAVGIAAAQQKNVAERLGYPADAKLVILHADDLGVAHSVDMASFAALDQKVVSSASVMVPCPWLTEVAAYAKAHPDADIGLHLTLTSEWNTYRWGPVAPKDQVASLLTTDGYFYPDVAPVALHATPEDVEREIRAQIELALKMGIHPTHLDMHMGTLAAKPEFYAVLVKVAHEYHLPFLAVHVPDAREKMMESLLSPNDVVFDSLVMFDSRIPAGRWTESYVAALKAIRPGVHYMIVHLGHDDSELQAVTMGHPDYGAAWRQRDFNAVTSAQFKKALGDNHIILIGWKDLKKLM
ncbi:MAG TPA: polysaccharide deacetylase family protein [Terriglobia bacterium]|nr:polysaccharide deacetylase family protein [Terriglobia bacterium]